MILIIWLEVGGLDMINFLIFKKINLYLHRRVLDIDSMEQNVWLIISKANSIHSLKFLTLRADLESSVKINNRIDMRNQTNIFQINRVDKKVIAHSDSALKRTWKKQRSIPLDSKWGWWILFKKPLKQCKEKIVIRNHLTKKKHFEHYSQKMIKSTSNKTDKSRASTLRHSNKFDIFYSN